VPLMTTRLGIELSPTACRIVEVEAGLAWHRRASDTRVRSFAVLPLSGPETRAKLASVRKQHAAVVVWNAPSEHRQVVVNSSSYESMRAEALGALADVGLPTRGVWADIAPASHPANRAARQPVVVALASAAEMSVALQPIIDAGIRVLAVTTPAMALGSLARLRRPFSTPDAVEAYVALEEEMTCIALVRGSVVIAAHELAWGYIDERQPGRQTRQRDDITKRLGDAIAEFITGIGGSATDIGQLCVCGGLPELRSMTAPLMERFDVEVEPLDSLFGIDADQLPEPVDEFRERGAELRLAWAVASDWPSPINLLRFRKRQASKTVLARAAVATGIAAGLVLGWRIERSQLWRSIETKPAARTATNVPERARGGMRVASPPAAAASKPVVAPLVVAPKPLAAPLSVVASGPNIPPPAAVAGEAPVAAPPAVVASKPIPPPPAIVQGKPPVTPPPAVAASKPVVVPPSVVASKPPITAPSAVVGGKVPIVRPPAVVASKPPVGPPLPAFASRPPVALPGPIEAPTRAQTASILGPPAVMNTAPREERPRPATQVPPTVRPLAPAPAAAIAALEAGQEPAPPRVRPAPAPEAALPFDAVLGTILYSPDRKLAIVDGDIVAMGDEVRGARVVEITPNAVMLRDGRGRLWRLGLGVGVR
jgi:hypothetical protein